MIPAKGISLLFCNGNVVFLPHGEANLQHVACDSLLLGMLKSGLISLLALIALPGFALADERIVVEDARDGVLEQRGLLESALELSGQLSTARRDTMLSRFLKVSNSTRKQLPRNTRDLSKARAFLKELHAELLPGAFDADCDGVEKAFESGRYNCVTTLILALEFCRREKISATGMQSGHHVWLRIGDHSDGDLETTRLDVREEDRVGGRRISDTQLLARLVYNQARVRHADRDFEEAVKRLEWCLLIDPGFAPAKRNLRIVLGNWMAAAESEFRFSEAIAVSQRGISRFPEDEEMRQNAAYLKETWDKWREQQAAE